MTPTDEIMIVEHHAHIMKDHLYRVLNMPGLDRVQFKGKYAVVTFTTAAGAEPVGAEFIWDELERMGAPPLQVEARARTESRDDRHEREMARCHGYVQGKENGRADMIYNVLAFLRAKPQVIEQEGDDLVQVIFAPTWAGAAVAHLERRFGKGEPWR